MLGRIGAIGLGRTMQYVAGLPRHRLVFSIARNLGYPKVLRVGAAMLKPEICEYKSGRLE